jgi:hypothetical protein
MRATHDTAPPATALDPASATLLRDLRAHARNVTPGRLAIAATSTARARHDAALQQFCEEFPATTVVAIGERAVDAALVVVLCEGPARPVAAYFQTVAAHGTDIPIVWGDPWRPYYRQAPPRHQNVGVTYEGMFSLLGQYFELGAPRAGAYCEFGVFDGRTFALAFHSLKHVCGRFHAFDSFRGLQGTLANEPAFADGDYAANVRTFEYNLRWSGVDRDRVEIVPGFFQDTLAGRSILELGVQTVNVAVIDVDIFVPAALALEFVAPALRQGSIVMFDDYDHLAADPDAGERRALREFLARHPEMEVEPYRNYGVAARAFLVHRRAATRSC